MSLVQDVPTVAPTSDAKTAYALLEDVIDLINQEPKRVDMHKWKAYRAFGAGGPMCNTVGCIAGWIGILKCLTGPDVSYDRQGDAVWGNQERALDVLAGARQPLLRAAALRLFLGNPPYRFPTDPQGTALYAASVIATTRRFMKRYQKALRARRVTR